MLFRSGYSEILNPESLSIANPEEGTLLLKHLRLLLEEYRLDTPLRIGIISPYKAQVQYLTEQLKEQFAGEDLSRISVKTVDGFQGQEKDVIYISLVRSNDSKEIGFLSDIRRMNVAITRARRKLVLFGDSATLGGHPFYKEFLEYTDSINAWHSAWEFINL